VNVTRTPPLDDPLAAARKGMPPGTAAPSPASPFGDASLLAKVREVLALVERLPAGEHQTRLSALLGDATFAMQQLQRNGNFYWPHPVGQPARFIGVDLAAPGGDKTVAFEADPVRLAEWDAATGGEGRR
jgi:hypothetical protein